MQCTTFSREHLRKAWQSLPGTLLLENADGLQIVLYCCGWLGVSTMYYREMNSINVIFRKIFFCLFRCSIFELRGYVPIDQYKRWY